MDVKIINDTFSIEIYGFSGIAVNGDYGGTAFKLMDKIWPVVKEHDIKTKGLNIWVYEPGEEVFAGVELYSAPPDGTGLEQKNIGITKYAYYKHIGLYSLLKQAGHNMRSELKSRGYETGLPYVEIYGHWVSEETRLETELVMKLK